MTHKVEQLVPKLELPKCEANITTQSSIQFRQYREVTKSDDCRYTAKYRIDGRGLCKLHAMQVALEILIKEGKT